MTNVQLADLLDHCADAAAATDGKARAAIWRVAGSVSVAIRASDVFEGWLGRSAQTPSEALAWIAGPPEELGVRALRACAAWLREETLEERVALSTPTPTKGVRNAAP